MIPIVELIRIEKNNMYGTFGVLLVQKEAFCVTLEPADRLNRVGQSCIPAMQYLCKRHMSPKFGETFIVADVPGRSNILFHAGNVAKNTEGCIILAQHFGKLYGDRAILNSGATFKGFMDFMKSYDAFHLTIKDAL